MPKITEAVIIFFVSCLKSYFLRPPVVQKQIYGETTKAWNGVLRYCLLFLFFNFLPELISSWKSSVFIWPTFPSSSKTTSYKETTEEVYFQHFYTANVWSRTQCTAQNSWRAELSRLVMTNPFTKRLFIHKLFSLNIKEITDETFNHPCLLTNHAIIVQWRNFA